MDNKPKIPKKCLSWKATAFSACDAMEEPAICKDIALALLEQCIKWEKEKTGSQDLKKK